MVPLFVGYAMIVWYFAAVHRRRIGGAVAVGLGLFGLLCLNWMHIKLGEWTKGEIYVPVLQTITYPYTGLVVFIGVFIWAIPRQPGVGCAGCRYNLEGLEPVGGFLVCPECGTRNATLHAYRPSGADRSSFTANDDRHNTAPDPRAPRRWHRDDAGAPPARVVSAPQQPPRAPDEQDAQGHAPDQAPAEQAQAAR